MVLPTLTPSGYLFPPAANSRKLNTNFGRITGMLWQANSFYHALRVVITKDVSYGVQVHGAYTRGKSIDTLSATVADDAFPNGLLNPLFFDERTTRGIGFRCAPESCFQLYLGSARPQDAFAVDGTGIQRMAARGHLQGFE